MFADRYELGASLGRGGMAEVFEAVAHGTHGFIRRVAIKRLLPEFGEDPHVVRMFLDEARTASHLHHSGIVAVLDFGVVEGCPFQVLELVEGWDAGKLAVLAKLRRKKVPVEIALLLANQVAHALAYAHARKDESGRPLGIVHRDVKPSNILVSRSGDVKLGDFGIALARERSAVSSDFSARGTPGYMSPEQLLGAGVGPRADIFGVGASLHALLTGSAPLMKDGYQGYFSGTELPVSPDLPLDAREIVVRALRMRPEERYASARELANALGEVLAPRLETDPTTRMTEWIEELEAQRPSNVQRVTTAVLLPMDSPRQFSLQAPTQVSQPHRPPLETPTEIRPAAFEAKSGRPPAATLTDAGQRPPIATLTDADGRSPIPTLTDADGRSPIPTLTDAVRTPPLVTTQRFESLAPAQDPRTRLFQPERETGTPLPPIRAPLAPPATTLASMTTNRPPAPPIAPSRPPPRALPSGFPAPRPVRASNRTIFTVMALVPLAIGVIGVVLYFLMHSFSRVSPKSDVPPPPSAATSRSAQ